MVPLAVLDMLYEVEMGERREAAERCARQRRASAERESALRKFQRVFLRALTRISWWRAQYARIAPLD
jgi:hypothetical protein